MSDHVQPGRPHGPSGMSDGLNTPKSDAVAEGPNTCHSATGSCSPISPFARFDNIQELLNSTGSTNVVLLDPPEWLPDNSSEELQGGSGYVKKALSSDQTVIAVKFLKRCRTASGPCRKKRLFCQELKAWSRLAHPNVLPLLGVVCIKNSYLGMVSPFMQNRSALEYVRQNTTADVLQILWDVAEGMDYLADQTPPIAHGDLKGANVLINSDGRACICDFGLSRFLEDCPTSVVSSGCGTVRWMAPEQLNSETMIVSLSADIYAWGMIALELITGSVPWAEIKQDCAIVKKVIDGVRPSRPKCQGKSQCKGQPGCVCLIGNDSLWALIQQAWGHDPDQRPSIKDLRTALLDLRDRSS